MATDVVLPDIGEGVTEGELVKWLVAVGDSVEQDQPIAEVMTDKATVEVPTPVSGTVKELKANEGDIIPIETTMLIVEQGAGATKPAKAKAPAAEKAAPPPPTPAQPQAVAAPSGGMEVYPPAASSSVLATPATRRLAREMNIDINLLTGTGNAGRVTREDVLGANGGAGAASTAPTTTAKSAPTKSIPTTTYQSPAGAVEERVPLRGIRRKIAEQMQMTKQVVPHFTIMDEANIDELVRLRTEAKKVGEQYGVKVTYLPFIMKALIATLKEFPMLNASIDDQAGEIVYKSYFNIGFAADTPNGLLVPVIKNADQKNILQISKEITELAEKARNGKLALDEMKGATITITNIGSVGGTYATPIINHPEVAIIGVYKLQTKPVWQDGEFKPCKTQNYTCTADHRLIDGAVAANFLRALFKRIENPSSLMLEMI